MDKPVLILKPSAVNALIPLFVRNLLVSLIIGLAIFFLGRLLQTSLLSWAIISFIVILLLPLLWSFLMLNFTQYIFYRSYVLKEYKFIWIKRKSVPYNQIVNITTNISVWDRMCKAGDIIFHTAEDKSPDIRLHYIKNPQRIETNLYSLMRKPRASIKP